MFGKKIRIKPQKWYVVEQFPYLGDTLRQYAYLSEASALKDAREFMANYGYPAFVLNEDEKEQWVLDKASKVLEAQ